METKKNKIINAQCILVKKRGNYRSASFFNPILNLDENTYFSVV